MCGPASYLSCDRRSLVDVRTGETAIQKGLAHRLEQLSIERQRRDRANARADEEFSAEFLSAARAVFLMIDKDDSGFLDKEEMSARCVRPSTCARRRPLIRHRRDSSLTARFPRSVTAVRADKEVIDFLTNCGNKNLQYLLVPSRLEAALAQLDSDRDGEIDCNEWCVSESGAWGGEELRRGDGVDAAHRSAFRAGRTRSRRRCGTSSRSAPRRARPRPRPPRRRSPSSRASS